MRALFGGVALLVVLAAVALLGGRQLRAVGRVGSAPAGLATGLPAAPQMSGSGTVGQQSTALQKQVVDDVTKAMNQAAEARGQAADKP